MAGPEMVVLMEVKKASRRLRLALASHHFARTQRGLHQPGLTHLTVSPTEECRLVNLHRTLEEFLGIGPEDG